MIITMRAILLRLLRDAPHPAEFVRILPGVETDARVLQGSEDVSSAVFFGEVVALFGQGARLRLQVVAGGGEAVGGFLDGFVVGEGRGGVGGVGGGGAVGEDAVGDEGGAEGGVLRGQPGLEVCGKVGAEAEDWRGC